MPRLDFLATKNDLLTRLDDFGRLWPIKYVECW
jgi:hypothetical protein